MNKPQTISDAIKDCSKHGSNNTKSLTNEANKMFTHEMVFTQLYTYPIKNRIISKHKT